jgi:hypothetical protein
MQLPLIEKIKIRWSFFQAATTNYSNIFVLVKGKVGPVLN